MAQEKTFENKVKKYLKEQGCYVVKYFGCAFTQSGIPDLLICCNGHFVAVELKATRGKTSKLQELNIEQIRKSGGKALVLYPQEFENFKLLIKELKK